MSQPPNLNELYGDRFRVVCEESLTAERGENARNRDPWLMIMPCKAGHILPWGREMLGASTNCRGPISKALAMLPCVQIVQDGHDGLNAIFPVEDFDTVAGVMKPRRRRRLNPEHRAKLVAAGAQNRFVVQHGSGAPENGQICDPNPQDVSRAA